MEYPVGATALPVIEILPLPELPTPIDIMVGPPPPMEIFGQESPPPSVLPPRKPILKPVRVMPHCALPIVLCQIEVSLLQIWLSMAFKRVVGLRRLTTTLRPVPLKNLSRQVKFLTLWGLGMSVSSAETRDVAAFAALWIRVVQDSLPVVWAIAGDAAANATTRRRARWAFMGGLRRARAQRPWKRVAARRGAEPWSRAETIAPARYDRRRRTRRFRASRRSAHWNRGRYGVPGKRSAARPSVAKGLLRFSIRPGCARDGPPCSAARRRWPARSRRRARRAPCRRHLEDLLERRRGRARRSSGHGVRGRSWRSLHQDDEGELGAWRRERDRALVRKLGLPQRGVGTGSIVTAAPTTEAVRPSGRRASESVGRHALPPFQSTDASLSTVSPKATRKRAGTIWRTAKRKGTWVPKPTSAGLGAAGRIF